MADYRINKARRRHIPRRLLILFVLLVVLIGGGIVIVRHAYYQELRAVSSSARTQIVTIDSGSTSSQIAAILAGKHLIRSAWAFELYVHSKQLSNNLQAGTYALAPGQDTPSIIATLTKGKVSTGLVTILPGRRLDQVRSDLINDGFSPTAVDNALKPDQYSNVSTLAYKPAGASLEGLLYPDSFERTADTDPAVIVRESLTEMGTHLTPDLQAAFAEEGLTMYQGITLASIIEKEVSKPTDRTQAAQVFLSRYKGGSTLGSDVTAYYGAILAGKSPSVLYDSPYNTRIHTGFPPTPISSISQNSLDSAAHPAATNWLYFVAGDDGTTYFSTTQAEHDAQAAKYCHKLCSE